MFRLVIAVCLITVLDAQEPDTAQAAKAAALNRALVADVLQRTTAVKSPAIAGYVEKTAARLAPYLPEGGIEFTFALMADHRAEPIALPGGTVFVPVLLLADAQNEAEFAGMLVHAMAQVAGSRQMTREKGAPAAGGGQTPLIFYGGWPDGESGVPLPVSEREIEADRVGSGVAAGAGYDPRGLLRYLERMRPACRADRIQALAAVIEEFPPRDYPASSDEFHEAQQEARRLTAKPTRPSPSLRRGH